MGEQINIGSLQADLNLNTTRLERGVANADNALYQIRKEIREVIAAFNAGGMSAREYGDRMGYLRDAQKSLQTDMLNATNAVGAQASALDQLAGAYGRAAGGAGFGGGGAQGLTDAQKKLQQQTRMAALALMQLGYVADDLQYGFRSVVNNIGPLTYALTTAFGGTITQGFALGAVIQMVAVSAYQLSQNWTRVMAAMDMPVVLTQAQQMEELGRQTTKTAEETAKLNKYKREQKEIADMLEDKTKDQKDRKKDITTAITESGDEKATGMERVVAGVAKARQAAGTGARMTDAERKELAEIDKAESRERIKGPTEEQRKLAARQGNAGDEIKSLTTQIKDLDKAISFAKAAGRNGDADRFTGQRDALADQRERLQGDIGMWGIQIRDIQRNRDSGFSAKREAAQDKINARINKEDTDRAKQLVQQATDDPKKLQELIGMYGGDQRKNIEAQDEARKAGDFAKLARLKKQDEQWKNFPAGTQKDFEDQLPENRKQQAAWEAQGEANAKKLAIRQAEATKEESEQKRNLDQATDKAAKGLSEGPGLLKALKAPLDDKATEALLSKVTTPEDAKSIAPEVTKKVNEIVGRKIQEHALANGQTFEESRKELINQEQTKAETNAAKKARKQSPGIDDYAENLVASTGGDPFGLAKVREVISKRIKDLDMMDRKKDLSDEEVADASQGIIDKAKHSVNEKVAAEQLNPTQERTKSQQFDAAELAGKIQSGVGPGVNEQKKSNTYLEQAVKYLAKMANEAGGNPFVVS